MLIPKYFPAYLFLHLLAAEHVNAWDWSLTGIYEPPFPIKPIPLFANYCQVYTMEINKTVSYLFEYPNYKDVSDLEPPRVTISSTSADESYPIIIVVQQRRSVLSWKLPLTIQSKQNSYAYHRTSRTLCTDLEDVQNPEGEHEMVISVSTSSPSNVNFSLEVVKQQNFSIKLEDEYETVITPSEPAFFLYNFSENVSSVLLEIDSPDKTCMTLSIQNISCPVFDLEHTIQYRGDWETVSSKGGIMLTRQDFPEGLYIVFDLHSDDSDCISSTVDGPEVDVSEADRKKVIRFKLNKNLNYEDYLFASLAVLLSFSSVFILSGLLLCCTRKSPETVTVSEESCTVISAGEIINPNDSVSADSSLDEEETDKSSKESKELVGTKTFLFVSDLSKKNPQAVQAKARLYFWNLLTVAVFYSLPVVQLVFTYQKVLNMSGNQDMCYYNFLCSHRLLQISDFNHVFTNIGYILLGLLFILLVYRKDAACQLHSTKGIPHHFGLYYSMGTALMMEGILSACYHICPNHSNIQFDTSFMYIIAMLSMLKIYQNRHSDINASAYTTYLVLACVIFIGMCGILNGSFIFYVVFTALHIITCFFLSLQIYYMGRWKLGFHSFKRTIIEFFTNLRAGLRHCKPMYPNRMVLLILGNACNWGLAVHLWMSNRSNFATYLLIIFMANLILYLTFYITMKLLSGERILLQPSLYIIFAVIFWGASGYFFTSRSTNWQLTPAESRTYNKSCMLLKFYDNHDIWHLISAGSMFFSFMVLLTLDDDLKDKERKLIPVF
nr:PREDICTED: SID1 transmembrane family member 1-like [Bemisia tabaci]